MQTNFLSVKNVSDIVIDDCVIAHFLKNNVELVTKADTIINQYKHYIFLLATCDVPLRVPSNEVDELWHSHLLHTRNYANFCNDVAGKFLHHKPYGEEMTTEEKIIQSQNLYNASSSAFGFDLFDIYSSDISNSTHCDGHCGDCA